jgi:hypothetical protein
MSLNTVAQCDNRLLQMELDWKLNRSGPFPDGIRNTISNLCAALAIREAEASHKTPAPVNAATPATSSTTTTTTTDLSTTASTETTTVAMAATVKLHKTTRDDSEEHKGSEERRGDEIGEGNKERRTAEEKSAEREGNDIAETRGDKRDEGERIARKASVKGENKKRERASEGIKENKGNVRGNPPPHTAHPTLERDNSEEDTRREPQHEHPRLEDGEYGIFERETLEFGENEVYEPGELEYEPTCGNAEVGNGLHKTREGKDYRVREPDNGTTHPAPSPTANEAANPGPREHMRFDWATETDKSFGPVPIASNFHPTKPQFPLASPEHAPCLFGNRIPPPQPVRTTPKRSITQPRHNTTPRACSPAVDPPSAAPPQVPAERAPTAVVHAPRDLSGLRSNTPNPWRSLRRRYHSRDSYTPRRFTRRRQYPPEYPINTHIPATPIPKPPAPTSIHVFETVTHPHGIGPSKPVIRVPTLMTRHTPTHPAQHTDRAIAKSETPLPLRV